MWMSSVSRTSECRASRFAMSNDTPASLRWVMYVIRNAWKSRTRPRASFLGSPAASRSLSKVLMVGMALFGARFAPFFIVLVEGKRTDSGSTSPRVRM